MALELLKTVYSTLSGDVTYMGLATGGVHQAMAPAKTSPPFGIFYQVPAAGPAHVFGGDEAFDEILIAHKGVAVDKDDGSAAGADLAEQIRERGKTLLANASLLVTGFTVLSILCDAPMPLMTEEVGGKTRYHRGDYFRVQLQKV
jgi:hypothetical protein